MSPPYRQAMLTAALATAAALLTSVQDVFPRGDAHSELRRVHPVTLAPSGPAVRLDGFLQGGWARSPGGTRLALGVSGRGRVQIVPGRVVRTGRRTVWWLLAWPRARRVVALGYGRSGGRARSGRAGACCARRRVSGHVVAGVTTADGLALLVAPPGRIADAELALVDAAGNERRIPAAGRARGLRPAGRDGNARSITPGLAVRDGVAYIATDTRVLEVDLTTGARIAHVRRRARRRAATGTCGRSSSSDRISSRSAARTTRARPSGRSACASSTRAPGPSGASPAARAARSRCPAAASRPGPRNRGLALLDENGQRRRTVLRGRRLVQVQAAGRYAYAVAHEPRHRTYVVDLRSGRVVKTLPTAQPGRLLN